MSRLEDDDGCSFDLEVNAIIDESERVVLATMEAIV